MIKGEGMVKACEGWYCIEDGISQTHSVWRDTSKIFNIFGGIHGDLRLFYITKEQPKLIMFPKIRAEEGF